MKMKRNMVLQLAVALILLFAILTFSMFFYIDKLNENFERELIRTGFASDSSKCAAAIKTSYYGT